MDDLLHVRGNSNHQLHYRGDVVNQTGRNTGPPDARQPRNHQCQQPHSPPSGVKPCFFLSYVYVKGACVSTALFMQHVTMRTFGGDFGFVNVISGHVSAFKQGFDFDPYETPNPIPNSVHFKCVVFGQLAVRHIRITSSNNVFCEDTKSINAQPLKKGNR